MYNPDSILFDTFFNIKSFENLNENWLRFEGNFHNDLKNGPGKLYLSNGEYLSAEWLNDKVNGFGVFYCLNGEQIDGEWR